MTGEKDTKVHEVQQLEDEVNAARDKVEKEPTEDNNMHRTEVQNSLIQKNVHTGDKGQLEKENRTAEPRERWKQALEECLLAP